MRTLSFMQCSRRRPTQTMRVRTRERLGRPATWLFPKPRQTKQVATLAVRAARMKLGT
jgi:hypothetical protein